MVHNWYTCYWRCVSPLAVLLKVWSTTHSFTEGVVHHWHIVLLKVWSATGSVTKGVVHHWHTVLLKMWSATSAHVTEGVVHPRQFSWRCGPPITVLLKVWSVTDSVTEGVVHQWYTYYCRCGPPLTHNWTWVIWGSQGSLSSLWNMRWGWKKDRSIWQLTCCIQVIKSSIN